MNGTREDLTTFVGRDIELAEVAGLLDTRRLVTLTGIGGCGKTRLGARVVSDISGRWPDGVHGIDLGPLADPSLIPGAVAAATGVPLEPGGEPIDRLATLLRRRRLLLWLDTCEHVLETAAEVAESVLAHCPHISVLATSREPLGITGETIWRVPPLSPPDAVRLFADRATLVATDFDADRSSEQVAAICARIDHIPLAVELAAAWVRALTPEQIMRGLDDSFRLLVGGPRNVAPRHRTLQASMAWSHDLLNDAERTLFGRLSVFAGPFTLASAAAVTTDTDEDFGPDVLAGITRLLDASLLTPDHAGDQVRYRMLDTVRQYAADRLDRSGEAEAIRDRHLDYFVKLATEAERGMDSDQEHWRTVLDGHRADIASAIGWGLSLPTDAVERAGRLAAAMARYWLISGQTEDGLRMVGQAIERTPDAESVVRSRLYAGQAMLNMAAARLPLAEQPRPTGAESPSTSVTVRRRQGAWLLTHSHGSS